MSNQPTPEGERIAQHQRCDCQWPDDEGLTDKPCGCGVHACRLYRDEVWHWNGQHWLAGCLMAELEDRLTAQDAALRAAREESEARERVIQNIVYAIEGKPLPFPAMADNGIVRRARCGAEAAEQTAADLRAQLDEAREDISAHSEEMRDIIAMRDEARAHLHAAQEALAPVLAQLRHAYALLTHPDGAHPEGAPLAATRQRSFADGLIAPQIRKLEALQAALAASPAPEGHK